MSNASDFIIENGVLNKYVGPGGDVVIPDGVCAIGVRAFMGCETVTSIFLPDSVKIIGDAAFEYCKSMTQIRLPKSMKLIRGAAFRSCRALASVEIPAGLEYIYQYTFEGCSCLKRVEVSEGITYIDNGGFSYCDELETLVLPMSVTKDLFMHVKTLTGNYGVLKNCGKLSSVVAPGIRLTDFSDPKDKLMAVKGYMDERERFVDLDIAVSYDHYILSQKKRVLPHVFKQDHVQVLSLFVDNGKITKVNIDTDFLEPAIEANATQCVSFLLNWKNENVPDGELLPTLKLNEKAKKTEKKKVEKDPYDPEKMKELWSSKKREDGTLELTKYKGTNKKINFPPRIGKKPVTRLGDALFSRERDAKHREFAKQLAEVHIPEGIVEIGNEAFYGCSKLKLVELPASIEKIGSGAFFQCSKLSEITFSERLTEICAGAFYNCVGLRDLVIPASVTQIGKNAFQTCYNLTIHAPAGSYAETYAKENNIPFVAE